MEGEIGCDPWRNQAVIPMLKLLQNFMDICIIHVCSVILSECLLHLFAAGYRQNQFIACVCMHVCVAIICVIRSQLLVACVIFMFSFIAS